MSFISAIAPIAGMRNLSDAAVTLTGLPAASVNDNISSFSPLFISPLALESAIVVSPDVVVLINFSPPDEPERPHAARPITKMAIAIDPTILVILTFVTLQYVI